MCVFSKGSVEFRRTVVDPTLSTTVEPKHAVVYSRVWLGFAMNCAGSLSDGVCCDVACFRRDDFIFLRRDG